MAEGAAARDAAEGGGWIPWADAQNSRAAAREEAAMHKNVFVCAA